MPHLTILYTPELESLSDMTALCRKLADTMLAQRDEAGRGGVSAGRHSRPRLSGGALGGGRRQARLLVRLPQPAHGTRTQRGGEEAGRRRARATARSHFGALFEQRHLGLTLQIDEGAEVYDAKHSTIHPLFAKPDHAADRDDQGARARALQARKNRVQVRHFSRRHPGDDDRRRLRDPERVGAARAGRRPQHQGTQDRPDLARDAAGEPDQRARLRAADGRHVLRPGRRHSDRALHRAAGRGRARLRPRQGAAGTRHQHVRRSRRDRVRQPGARDHRCPDRAVRPRRQGHAQGLRHDLGLRRQRRDRPRRSPGAPRRDRSALGRRDAVQERRDRGNRPRRRRAQPSGDRRCVAGEQDRRRTTSS